MAPPRRPPQHRGEPRDRVAALAQEALDAFRHDLPKEYKELVETFDNRGADLALLGHGRFHLAVRDGQASINPKQQAGRLSGRGAATPDTIHSLLDGESTALEEFFRGNLIAQAPSEELHLVYEYFVRFAGAALQSEGMRKVADRFRKEFPREQRYELE
jgi:hypothetical protein